MFFEFLIVFFSNHLLSFPFLTELPLALNTIVIVRAALSITASIKRWGEIFIGCSNKYFREEGDKNIPSW